MFAHRHDLVMRDFAGHSRADSPAPELAARRCTTRSSATRTLVLVTEDQPALLEVVGRHFDRHPIARQRLDPVLLHLAGGVGDNFVTGALGLKVKPNEHVEIGVAWELPFTTDHDLMDNRITADLILRY